MKDLSL